VATVHGRGSSKGGPRDHDHIDVLPQHPERAIWAHEGREEFQGISPDAESLRLLEERWLWEAHPDGMTGGVSRWRLAPPASPTARCLASIRRAELAATARLSKVGKLLVTTGAGRREPAPTPPHPGVQGCPLRRTRVTAPSSSTPSSPDHRATAPAAPAATPLLTPPDARPALHVEAWRHADLCDEEALVTVIEGAELPAHHQDVDHLVAVAAGDDPFEEQAPNGVTRGLQTTWEASDVEGARA
jgi:hypothetical protein